MLSCVVKLFMKNGMILTCSVSIPFSAENLFIGRDSNPRLLHYKLPSISHALFYIPFSAENLFIGRDSNPRLLHYKLPSISHALFLYPSRQKIFSLAGIRSRVCYTISCHRSNVSDCNSAIPGECLMFRDEKTAEKLLTLLLLLKRE